MTGYNRLACMTILAAGALLAATVARADSTIGGWTVSTAPDKDGLCAATYAYVDKDDDNKKNSVVFGLMKDKTATAMVLVFGYQDWKFDKGQAVNADIVVDGTTMEKDTKWEGDGQVLTTTFADAANVLPTFGSGKKIVLRFGKDGEANFLTPNAGLALGATQLCLDQKS